MPPPGAQAITSSSISELRQRSTGHLFMVGVAVTCGLMGAAGAIVFRLLIRLVQGAMLQGFDGVMAVLSKGLLVEVSDPIAAFRALPWYHHVLAPALGGLLVGPLIWRFARESRGNGVPEVMAAVALRGGVIRPRVPATTAVASAITLGTGGSAGREGPIVQIGAAMGSTLGQLLRVPASQLRTIVGCGAAAGLAATFNAPIAGAIFAAEIIVGNFAVAQLSPIVISSVVATVVSRFFLGDHPALKVPPYHLVSPFELLPYLVIGLVAGLVALAFLHALYATDDFFLRLKLPDYVKPAIGGLLVGVLGFALPQVHGSGYQTISAALTGSIPLALLGILVVAKIAATSLTLGSGATGGIFAPSLFMGAMAGGFFGTLFHDWFPGATASSGAYAVVTMGAVVAAATHAPISAILIIFELTQTIRIIPPLMAACVVSTLVATLLYRDSIYTTKLHRRGIDLYEEEGHNVLKSLFVHDILDREPEVLPASANLGTVLEHVLESERADFFIVNEQGELIGGIHLRELTRMLVEQDVLRHVIVAGDLAHPNPTPLNEDDDLDVVLHVFSQGEAEELPIVARDDPRKLVGSVHKRDVIHAYNREVMRRDLAGQVSSNVLMASRGQQVELGGGYVLQEVQPPPRFFGKTIRENDIGNAFGVQVVLLRKRNVSDGGSTVRVATANERIDEGDRLVVAGTKLAVESLDVI
jgi:CIC family chloride channel protein